MKISRSTVAATEITCSHAVNKLSTHDAKRGFNSIETVETCMYQFWCLNSKALESY